MATRLREDLEQHLDELRYEPTEKRIRGELGGETAFDTTRALIVWLPGRVVPTYAVPQAELRAGEGDADPALPGYAILRFADFDAVYEEDERNYAHPKDPFHRIDILSSSRHVRVERDGVLLAESTRPTLLFETRLPVRFYLPREDVVAAAAGSDRRTWCAYKGEASYLTFGGEDLAWYYASPQKEAADIKDLVAFFDEHVDVTVDGEPRERPSTPWS
jgi:uncharacterized protein (DUF427 family)